MSITRTKQRRWRDAHACLQLCDTVIGAARQTDACFAAAQLRCDLARHHSGSANQRQLLSQKQAGAGHHIEKTAAVHRSSANPNLPPTLAAQLPRGAACDAARAPRRVCRRPHLVTACIASARWPTFLVVTPAMLMRPLRVR